ncbi:hypothetical protein LAZ67_18000920 [Cordylochernes scorpioides]|uniref:SPIN-DOC-like zinc-finger domain-containing protein n=1 Tax=Cordylochernes scorpioides TaxID=51811 RepID=A0ABY6LG59_9ARAC|nr:hypothetical protein LAZ67_18000920 [Cordylochernes scorpioides]
MSSSKPSGSKTKRKIADEHRNFQEKWELEYFCSEVKDKIICLICNNAISVPNLYNIKRHYEQHKSKYDTYEGLMRQEKLKEFKLGMKNQQFMFTKVSQESEAVVHASYVLSEMIAKHSKPFTEGDFIKECLIKAAEIVCPGSVKTFQAISLSRNTVVERVTDMARNLNDKIKEKSSCFEAFSIACDETCDTDFNIFEELLELVPMHGTTTGEDIFNCVYDLLQKYNLPQSKLTSVATDGAPSMTGKTNGFVALLRKKLSEISDGSNLHHTHCIIHQEVLCTKVIKIENVLTPIKKFINFIRSRGLNQRQFSLFLTELESEYSGLSYYTEVRWLSCSKVLKQFWDLKEEICQFLITKNQDITLFSDQLVLREKQLKNEDLMHFPTCNMYKSSLGETASYQKYAKKNLSLRNEFETRFSDFKSLEGKFTLFSSIFSINIESVPNHMQMEVIDIKCDSDLKAKFIEVSVSEFYKYLPARFENTRKLAYEIMSMFGSTYRCEQLFSLMKGNKSPIRSRNTDVHLGSVLKLITANKISPISPETLPESLLAHFQEFHMSWKPLHWDRAVGWESVYRLSDDLEKRFFAGEADVPDGETHSVTSLRSGSTNAIVAGSRYSMRLPLSLRLGALISSRSTQLQYKMAASDMRNRCHVQPLLTWSTNSSCIPGSEALTGNDDIVEAVLSEKMEISSSDDSSSTSEDSLEPDVPRCEALKSLDVALKYLEKRTEPEMLASYNTINSLRTMLMREEEALADEALRKETYVDDIVTGAEDSESVMLLREEPLCLLQKGGFVLKKWASNDPTILNQIPEDARLKKIRFEVADVGRKLLSVACYRWWKKCTIPWNGWCPLIQPLWVAGKDWDAPINGPIKEHWKKFREQLGCLRTVRIPRWLGLMGIQDIQLLGFSDASENAYAAAVYIRISGSDGSRAELVAAKARLSPFWRISIPLLELSRGCFANLPNYTHSDGDATLSGDYCLLDGCDHRPGMDKDYR